MILGRELAQQLDHLEDLRARQRVVDAASRAARTDHAAGTQQGKVLTGVWLRDAERLGNLTHRQRSVPQTIDDEQPLWVGKSTADLRMLLVAADRVAARHLPPLSLQPPERGLP